MGEDSANLSEAAILDILGINEVDDCNTGTKAHFATDRLKRDPQSSDLLGDSAFEFIRATNDDRGTDLTTTSVWRVEEARQAVPDRSSGLGTPRPNSHLLKGSGFIEV